MPFNDLSLFFFAFDTLASIYMYNTTSIVVVNSCIILYFCVQGESSIMP